MALLKSIARKIVFPTAVTLNLEKLFSLLSSHNRLILCYHGVVETPNHQVSLGPLPERQFQRHLEYFKRNFDVVSLDTIFQMYRSDFRPKRKTIALTFDDGYENNYHRVFPLLKSFNFPATMFIISQSVENENAMTWYDTIDFVKTDLKVGKLDTSKIGDKKLGSISELKDFIKTLNISKRRILFDEINKQTNIETYKQNFPREYWKLMNARQIRELSDSGLVEIGAHTHNHPNLGLIDIEDARKEVSLCKSTLEEVTQKEIKSLAFPDGSYNDDVKKVCLESGYKNLIAVDCRCASDTGDKSILPRCGIASTTTYESSMIHVNSDFRRFGF